MDKLEDFPGGPVVKNPPTSSGNPGDNRFYPWVQKIPWRRKWQPIAVFSLGKSHEERRLVTSSLVSPWGFKELNTTEIT